MSVKVLRLSFLIFLAILHDGSTSLPYRSGGRFHLGGETVVSPLDTFLKTIEAIIPILSATQDTPCVIIPPLPRDLFDRCCDDNEHCTNFSQLNFAQNLLSGYIQLRNLLIRSLAQKGLTNFKVMDTCCITACKNTANTTTRLSELRQVTAKDGVHFVSAGYANLAARMTTCLAAMFDVPKKVQKPCVHLERVKRD